MRVSPAAVTRLKTKLRGLLSRGRGRRLADVVTDLNLATRGWVVYFRLAEANTSFEDLDQWLRRKLRCVVWRQWKRPQTRLRELRRRGLNAARARGHLPSTVADRGGMLVESHARGRPFRRVSA